MNKTYSVSLYANDPNHPRNGYPDLISTGLTLEEAELIKEAFDSAFHGRILFSWELTIQIDEE